jgi:hypothetical protein
MGRAVRRVVLAGLAAGAVLLCGGGLARAQTAAVERTADGGAAMVVHATSGRDYFASSFLGAGGLPSRFAWRVGFRSGPQLLPEQAREGCTASVTLFEFECVLPDGAVPRPPVLYAEQGDDGVDLHLAGGPVVLYAGAGDDIVTAVRTDGAGVSQPPAGAPLAGVRSEIYGGTGDDSINRFGHDWLQLYGPLPASCRTGPHAPLGAVLRGGPGQDRVCDTLGDDRLVVSDGEPDAAGCTDGRDLVVADQFDFVVGECERVERAGRHAAAAFEVITEVVEAYDRHLLVVVVGCQSDGPAWCPVRLRLTWPGRGKQLGKVQEFGMARGYTVRPFFRFLEDTLDRLARTGVRATTFTELRSGRVVRTSRLLEVPPLPEGGN